MPFVYGFNRYIDINYTPLRLLLLLLCIITVCCGFKINFENKIKGKNLD